MLERAYTFGRYSLMVCVGAPRAACGVSHHLGRGDGVGAPCTGGGVFEVRRRPTGLLESGATSVGVA